MIPIAAQINLEFSKNGQHMRAPQNGGLERRRENIAAEDGVGMEVAVFGAVDLELREEAGDFLLLGYVILGDVS